MTTFGRGRGRARGVVRDALRTGSAIVGRGRGRGRPIRCEESDDDDLADIESLADEQPESPIPARNPPSRVESEPEPAADEATCKAKPAISRGIKKRMDDLQRECDSPTSDYFTVLNIPKFKDLFSNVPLRQIYRTPCKFTPRIGDSDDVFFHLQDVHQQTWLASEDNEILFMDFVQYCAQLMSKPSYKAYPSTRLPGTCELKLEMPVEATCHVVRCTTPSDFHVILLQKTEWFDMNERDRKWTQFFRKQLKRKVERTESMEPTKEEMDEELDKYCFKTPGEAYRGMTVLLSEFIKSLRSRHHLREQAILARMEFVTGDLVIVQKQYEAKVLAFRGVVIEPVKIITSVFADPVEDSFIVYLLDTGEQRVVSRKILVPLPRPFIGFRPLALHCSLSGITPEIGCTEWSDPAISKIREFFDPKGIFEGRFLLKFYPKKGHLPPPEILHSETLKLIDELAYSDPYSVDMTVVDTTKDIAEELVDAGVAHGSKTKFDSNSTIDDILNYFRREIKGED